MPTTYSDKLRLSLMGTGEQAGTWGDVTNTNLGSLIEQAIAGYVTVSIVDSDSPSYSLVATDGAVDEARSMALNITSSVTLTATRSVICPSKSKLYVVKNATTGGQSIILKTSAGSGITIPNGSTNIVLCNGTSVVETLTLPATGVLSVTGTAPVVSSGGTTPAISMPAATASVNGYMTSTYANKLDGIAAGATNVTNTNQLANGAGFVTSAGTVANAGFASTVTVTDSDAASTYRMVWNSGTSLYNTGGIYCNPSIDYVYANDFVAASDERLKKDWGGLGVGFLEGLAGVKYGTYTKISSGARQVGVTAQSLQSVLPEAVHEGENGFLAVSYGNAALVACVELAKEVQRLRTRIEALEK
jgi:hypothetical protein